MTILYDQFGREIRVEKRPERREIAAVALRDRWSGYPSKGLTPQKLARIFLSADGGDVYQQAELFEEMEEKDTHLFSQLQTRKNAVLGLDYEVLPYEKGSDHQRIADFVSDVLFSLDDFDDALLDLLDAVGKGFSISEILWGTDNNRAVVTGINWIHQKRAVFTDYRKDPWSKDYQAPRITTETDPSQGEDMPPFKLLYHRYKARSGYDTRAGVLRVCAYMYLFKNYAIKDWVSFLEIFGIPLRLGKYDAGAGPEDKEALVTAIQSLGSDAAGIISRSTEIEFIETVKGQSQHNPFESLGNFCDAQMSKAILGQTLTTQEGSSGSYSLGQVHDLVRHDLIKADSEALMKTIRFQLIRPLVGYNFGWNQPLPWFTLKFEPPEDLKSLSEVYKNLSELNYPLTVEHISERFKVPVPQKGETVLEKRTAPAAFKYILKSAPGSDTAPEQDELDRLIAATGKEGDNALSGFLGPVKTLVMNAGSLEEIKNGLFAMYEGMDADRFRDLLARAMYAAELYGRISVGD